MAKSRLSSLFGVSTLSGTGKESYAVVITVGSGSNYALVKRMAKSGGNLIGRCTAPFNLTGSDFLTQFGTGRSNGLLILTVIVSRSGGNSISLGFTANVAVEEFVAVCIAGRLNPLGDSPNVVESSDFGGFGHNAVSATIYLVTFSVTGSLNLLDELPIVISHSV